MIYRRDADNSTDDTDARRNVRDTFCCLRMTSGYTSVTTRSVAETPQDTPGQHRDASGHIKDAPDRYTDLAETRGD